MASTGGGAARSGKKRNPDVADPEEASQAELVGTVGTNDAIDFVRLQPVASTHLH